MQTGKESGWRNSIRPISQTTDFSFTEARLHYLFLSLSVSSSLSLVFKILEVPRYI